MTKPLHCCATLAAGEELVAISSLPEWAQAGFKGMKSLNRIQSRVCDCAHYSTEVSPLPARIGEVLLCTL